MFGRIPLLRTSGFREGKIISGREIFFQVRDEKRGQSNEIKDVKLQTENRNKGRRIDIQTGKTEI